MDDNKPANPARRRIFQAAAAVGLAAPAAQPATAAPAHPARRAAGPLDARLRAHVKNVVVVFLENRSFDNLFADFPGTARPLSALAPSSTLQRDRDGSVLPALPKVWGGIVPQRQNLGGKDYAIAENAVQGLPNAPFLLTDADGKPLPEGIVTRDLWHLFYQNQMQINGGRTTASSPGPMPAGW